VLGGLGCYVTCPNAVSSRVIHLVFHRLQHNCFSSLDLIKLVYQHPLERRSAATETVFFSFSLCLLLAISLPVLARSSCCQLLVLGFMPLVIMKTFSPLLFVLFWSHRLLFSSLRILSTSQPPNTRAKILWYVAELFESGRETDLGG
jgi:hypothetical protein